LFRTSTAKASLIDTGQRLELSLLPLTTSGGTGTTDVDPALRPTGPLSVEAIDFVIQPPDQLAISGEATVIALEETDTPNGDGGGAAAPFRGDAAGWSWNRFDADPPNPYEPPPDRPNTLVVPMQDPVFGAGGAAGAGRTFRLLAGLEANVRLPAVVSAS